MKKKFSTNDLDVKTKIEDAKGIRREHQALFKKGISQELQEGEIIDVKDLPEIYLVHFF